MSSFRHSFFSVSEKGFSKKLGTKLGLVANLELEIFAGGFARTGVTEEFGLTLSSKLESGCWKLNNYEFSNKENVFGSGCNSAVKLIPHDKFRLV